ncbi:TPA: replication protein P [Legionella anisa]|uniref:replication protein P n=1 Tax=Legionella anisa TaxID=28082 RepID=UPI00224308B8|nr:replication protein P [Legionella anisa]MCW8425642.1 replication protein P [Legionella anisa]MCW8448929.1 replication protein P [Legionella anisa]
MEHISNLINTSSLTIKREETQRETVLDPHVVEVVNKIFVFFYAICRGFDKQYQDPKRLNVEKTQWVRAFMDIGFNTLEKVKLGIKKCRLESPINTPTIGQFVKWCTPSIDELGIPCLESAYEEACKNSSTYLTEKKWSHQAVYHAWKMCNSHDLRTLSKKNTFPIFERNYDITVKMIMRGEKLKEIPLAITHDKDSETKLKIAKEFEDCKSHQASMSALSRILGKKFDGSSNQGRMQKNSVSVRN